MAALGAVIALAASAKEALTGHLLINFTPSVPRGVYWISPPGTPARGNLVAIRIPENVQQLVLDRRFLPPSIKLLAKPVAAVAGDEVCVRGEDLFINGAFAGHIVATDRLGLPMPVERICRRLFEGELYVSTGHDRSFDSRNFGPIRVESVRGTLTAVVTF